MTIDKTIEATLPPLMSDQFWANVTREETGCWHYNKNINKKTGYAHVSVAGKTWLAHRLAWKLINGRDPRMFILHSCDNRRCVVNPNHLREGTVQDNADDMTNRNRQARGEKHGIAVLNEQVVREIKTLIAQQVKPRFIAQRFDIPRYLVYNVKREVAWAWVTI